MKNENKTYGQVFKLIAKINGDELRPQVKAVLVLEENKETKVVVLVDVVVGVVVVVALVRGG